MSLENYTGKISAMVLTNPTGSDKLSEGDDHIRGIKKTISMDCLRVSDGPENIKRYGAIGDGITNDTAAIQAAIDYAATNTLAVYFPPGRYAVTSITFPSNKSLKAIFDKAMLVGIASVATDCVVRIKSQGSTFEDILVDVNFNTNYKCGVWWYDDAAASQFNFVRGCQVLYAGAGTWGLIYGALPGATATAFAQSENVLAGFRTRGCQNPFYGNHALGVLFCQAPMFAAHNEEWPPSPAFDWTAARAIVNKSGLIYCQGGEIQKSGSNLGLAAELTGFWSDGMNIEVAAPVQVIQAPGGGGEVNISGGQVTMTVDSKSAFNLAPGLSNARLVLNNVILGRPAGLAAYDDTAIVDSSTSGSALNLCEIVLNDCQSIEWKFASAGRNAPLVKRGTTGPVVVIRKLDYRAAAGDVISQWIDNTRENLLYQLPARPNAMGYAINGWIVNNASGTGVLAMVSDGNPPPAFINLELQFTVTGGLSSMLTSNGGRTSLLEQTAFQVTPGQSYWGEAMFRYVSGSNAKLIARFYNAAGVAVSDLAFVDEAVLSAPGADFQRIEGMVTVPSSAVWMGFGVQCTSAQVRVLDMRLLRASKLF